MSGRSPGISLRAEAKGQGRGRHDNQLPRSTPHYGPPLERPRLKPPGPTDVANCSRGACWIPTRWLDRQNRKAGCEQRPPEAEKGIGQSLN